MLMNFYSFDVRKGEATMSTSAGMGTCVYRSEDK